MLKDRQAVAVKVGWCGVTYYYGLGFVIATRWFLWIKLGSLREFWTVDDAMHLGYRSFHNLFQIFCIYVVESLLTFQYYSCMWLNAGTLPLSFLYLFLFRFGKVNFLPYSFILDMLDLSCFLCWAYDISVIWFFQ